VDFNHHLCIQRSEIDFLQHRLEGTNTADGHKAVSAADPTLVTFNEWFTGFKPKIGEGQYGASWKDTCKSMQASDVIFGKLLTALSAYASALAAVANDDYSGTNIGNLVADLNSLVGSIPGAPTAATAALGALGSSQGQPGPIGQLGGALEQHYAAHKVQDIVKNADPSVTKILAGIGTYLAAVGTDEAQWETDTRTLIDSIEHRLDGPPAPPVIATAPTKESEPPVKPQKSKPAKEVVPPPPPPPVAAPATAPPPSTSPVALMEFYQFARQSSRTMAATKKKLGAMSDAVQQLEQAEQALSAANGSNSPSLATVLGTISTVLSDIAAVQSAIAGGATQ
jgi:hypothetical protein